MEKNIFVFNKNKCVGCSACSVACMNENGFQSPDRWRSILLSNPGQHPFLPLSYLSIACNHCDDAPCMKHCPALAYIRDENSQAVIHLEEHCIGCKYCTWVCPYDAPKYNPDLGIVQKCTFCNHLIMKNETPACTQNCPTGALQFEKIKPGIDENIGFPVAGIDIGAKLKIMELENLDGPERDQTLFEENSQIPVGNRKKSSKITAEKEWMLIAFTLLAAGLVGTKSSGFIDLFGWNEKYGFLAAGLIAILLSFMHLGNKKKAWRAILNIKKSWISREILLLGIFGVLVLTDWFIFSLPDLIFLIIGFALLYAIDMVYSKIYGNRPIMIHSSLTILIGLHLYVMLEGFTIPLIALVLIRSSIYLYQELKSIDKFTLNSFIRLLCLWGSATLIIIDFGFNYAILFFAVGELIDRISFYDGLDVPEAKTEIQKGKQRGIK